MTYRFAAWILAGACGVSATASAQEAGARPASGLTRAVTWAQTALGENGTNDGFYPELGGLIAGSGVSLGPGFRHGALGDRMRIDVSGAASLRGSKMMQSRVEWPRLLDSRLSIGADVKYSDFTNVNFFGVGAGAPRANRVTYGLKYTDVEGHATVRPARWLAITGRGGMLRGTIASEAARYAHAGLTVDADTRDVPGYPSSGGRYRFSASAYNDRASGTHSFRQFEGEAARWVPVSTRSVLSFHGRLDVSQTADGHDVPFYLLPALGGRQTLRGYDNYRFRDRDAVLVNAEYRTRVTRSVDAAIFYDAGSVAPSVSDLARSRVRTDYGAGVRIHSKHHLIMRLDVARGSEGLRTIVSFTPLGFATPVVAPFVP